MDICAAHYNYKIQLEREAKWSIKRFCLRNRTLIDYYEQWFEVIWELNKRTKIFKAFLGYNLIERLSRTAARKQNQQ